ncbi:muramoyltetrapeptide carboxypeptidase [Aquisalibacillus elongatus]|uniref:Muramoyltetrapeptide carboxypeptidase n=2 Tax=Aquisalibacillus elongatus TaxID=485577 RepID=A0A3N5B1P1_9BACI|nr:muramoyltetrapeptide carboxypeptidase [Aquisalibacillus elongatus]
MLPQALQPGDQIGIVAPASPPNLSHLNSSLTFFKKLNLKVKLAPNLKCVDGYLAGSDEVRISDLHMMFEDPDIKAIFCACGGYGTSRLVSNLDYNLISQNPKIFWGYSDITYLHTAIRQQTGLITFHGPMPASDIGKSNFNPQSELFFKQLFLPTNVTYDESISPLTVIHEGEATGELVGGNLSLIVSSLGTPYEINTQNKLLLIEDVDEPPYRIDSYLSQLKHAEKLQVANGIVIGDFHNCTPKDQRPSWSLTEVFQDYFQEIGIPVLKGFKIGHCQPHISIPLGTKAILSTHTKSLIVQPGVKEGQV